LVFAVILFYFEQQKQFIRYITKQTQGVFAGVVTQPLNKGNKNKKLGNQDAQNTTAEKHNRGQTTNNRKPSTPTSKI
jgi:hypothetical protein